VADAQDGRLLVINANRTVAHPIGTASACVHHPPATRGLAEYGITGKRGTAPGELNTPDGFDLLLPDGSTPTHPVTGLMR
jgi:hypothetical protein